MNNLLNGKAQVIDLSLVGRVVWYHPDGSPDVLTDADVVAQDGDMLTILRWWWEETISLAWVERSSSPRPHETQEMRDSERAEYDQVSRGGVSTP